MNYEVNAAYVRLVLQAGHASQEALLQGSSLTEDSLAESEFVSWQAMARVFDNLDHYENSSAWTVQLGERLNITSHGPMGFAALTAPTLGEAIDVIGVYYATRLTAIETALTEEQGRYVLTIKDLTADPLFACRVAEIVLKVVECLIVAVLGHLPGKNVMISLARPTPNEAAAWVAGYDGEVCFDAKQYSISIPASWRRLPSPLYERSAYTENIIKCQKVIEGRQQFGGTAQMLDFFLRGYFDACAAGHAVSAHPPTLEDLANKVHVVPRTLIRRLKQDGVSYKAILEGLRKEYSQQMLTDASLTVADISTRLGYTEPANFGRAFRRWFDVSPAAWRKRK